MRWLTEAALAFVVALSACAAEAEWSPVAVEFLNLQQTIQTGAPAASWQPAMEKLAQLAGHDVLTNTVRELARVWLARARMKEIETALRGYYRRHARFPDSLEKLDLPPRLRADPWGEPWSYRLCAPVGLERLTNQRHQLGPRRHPRLAGPAPPLQRSWTIQLRDIAGRTALEVRTAAGSTALIEPGGVVDGCTLLHIGTGKALLADVNSMFTVRF